MLINHMKTHYNMRKGWRNEPKEVSERSSFNEISTFPGFQDFEHENDLNLGPGCLFHDHFSFFFELIALPLNLSKPSSYFSLLISYAFLIIFYFSHLCFHSFDLEPHFHILLHIWFQGHLLHIFWRHVILRNGLD